MGLLSVPKGARAAAPSQVIDEMAGDEENPGAVPPPSTPEPSGQAIMDAYMVSVWAGNDGKHGVGVKVWVSPVPGETITQAAQRANKMAVLKLREVEGDLANALSRK